MLNGSADPLPSASTPYAFQGAGVNCIGPTARSELLSPANDPPAVSRVEADDTPFRAGPMIRGDEVPSELSVAPWKRPWLDSTRPMPASSDQSMPQPGDEFAIRAAATR